MRRSLAAAVAVVVLAALASACSKGEPAAVTAPPPAAGYTRVTGENFTIDMPVGWHQPPLDPASFDQAATALRAQNPNLAEGLEAIRQSLGQGSRLFAIDPADGSSVNLIVTGSDGKSLSALVGDAVRQLTGVGVTDLREEPVRVGARAGVRLEFGFPVKGTAGSLSVPETQVYVVNDDLLFVLTLLGSNPSLTVVADSLRIT
ncbi:MAG: hypothetical protein ACRD2W_19465 [Acidimicrobiales bacterium]